METEKKKILIVEDEKKIAQVLAYNMKKEGYDCEIAYDGETGLAEAIGGGYDLILLDIMLPKMNGFEVCEKIRLVSQVPIIFVTAREEEKDKILGLDTGADDYVTKPFNIMELKARIRALLRRSAGNKRKEQESSRLRCGDLIRILCSCNLPVLALTVCDHITIKKIYIRFRHIQPTPF